MALTQLNETTRKKAEKGGNEAGTKNYYTARGRAIAGAKGIYVTCVRGKESRCVGEMYDLLDEVSTQLACFQPQNCKAERRYRCCLWPGTLQLAHLLMPGHTGCRTNLPS